MNFTNILRRPLSQTQRKTTTQPTAEDRQSESGLSHKGTDPLVGNSSHLTPANILYLQRTIGNHAVTQLLAQRKSAPVIGKTQIDSGIQRKTVKVAGGEFKDDVIGQGYRASNDDESDSTGTYLKVGAQIELEFVPSPSLDAEQVSLVQTTKSTIQNTTNPTVPDQSNSLLDKRRTDSGSAIDQEIYLSEKTIKSGNQRWETARLLPLFTAMSGKGQLQASNDTITKFVNFFAAGGGANNGVVKSLGVNPSSIKGNLSLLLRNEGPGVAAVIQQNIPIIFKIMEAQTKSINLDPRYSEERTDTQSPLKAPRAPGKEQGSGGWTAVKKNGLWANNAALRDAPGHKVNPTNVVNGQEQFETAALADGKTFIGSIRWGYTVINTVSSLNPATIELINYGNASSDLFKAAKKWNAMMVPDVFDEDTKHRTLQLPESDQAEKSAKIAFDLRGWMNDKDTVQVMESLGPETIERHYGSIAIGRIREGVDSVDNLVSLVVKLTEARGPEAVKKLSEASENYSTVGFKSLCAKPIDQLVQVLYAPK